jgi:hypothetical protein
MPGALKAFAQITKHTGIRGFLGNHKLGLALSAEPLHGVIVMGQSMIQELQPLQDSGRTPKRKSTRRFFPRPTKPIALACHISEQTRTHRPQRTQFSCLNNWFLIHCISLFFLRNNDYTVCINQVKGHRLGCPHP